jgi:hypothetical protein
MSGARMGPGFASHRLFSRSTVEGRGPAPCQVAPQVPSYGTAVRVSGKR